MTVLEQINNQEIDNQISVSELREAIKPGGFLDNTENILAVGQLLNSTESLDDTDKELLNSLKNTIDNEINSIIERGTATGEDIMLINVRKKLLGENDDRVQRLEEIITAQNSEANQDITEETPQISEGPTKEEIIMQKFNELSEQNRNDIKNNLNFSGDIINDIDGLLETGNIDFTKIENIKAINLINDIIKNDIERHNKLKNIVNEKTIAMSRIVNTRIGGNTKGNVDYYHQDERMVIQLRANVCYGEELELNGIRGNNIWNVGETNEGKTNIYIYQLELKTRKDITDIRKNFNQLLNIPNIDAKFNGISPEARDSIMREFLEFFLKIKMHGMFFENKIGTIEIEKVLTNLINAEKYKGKSVDRYLEIGESDELPEDEQERRAKIRESLSGFVTIGQYFRKSADESMNNLLAQEATNVEENRQLYEVNEIRALQLKIQELYNIYNNNEISNEEKRTKMKILGNEILNNPKLEKEQRNEILILLGGEFSEILTYNTIKTKDEIRRKALSNGMIMGTGDIYRGEEYSNSYKKIPIVIKSVEGCKIDIEYHIDTEYHNGNREEINRIDILIDGKIVKLNENGNPYLEGYEIHIDENNYLIINKGGLGSDLQKTFGSDVYEEYQIAQKDFYQRSKKNEELNDIMAQIDSNDVLGLGELTDEDKKTINDETGYTERYNRYLQELEGYNNANRSSGGSSMYRADSGTYTRPKEETQPKYGEYHELNIPGSEKLIVHIEPSQLNKINEAIQMYGERICFIPTKKTESKIYELKLADLKITEQDGQGNIKIFEIKNDLGKGDEYREITADNINEANHINNLIMSTITKAPGLEDALNKARNLSNDIDEIQKLYKKLDRGSKNEDGSINEGLNNEEIDQLRLKATNVAEYLDDICKHHNDFVQLKKGLEDRYSGESNISTENEQIIKNYISSLDYMINATIKGGDIYEFCQAMLNTRDIYANADWRNRVGHRFKNNLIRTIGAIAGGVLAVMLVPVTGGSSLVILAKMAMIMTAGGMIAGGASQMANERIQSIYYAGGTEINGKWVELQYNDPTSLELAIQDKITRGEYATQTVMNFVIGSATTFGCMYAGQMLGGRITKTCESGKLSQKFENFLKKFNRNFKGENGDPATENMFRQLANKIGKNPNAMINDFNQNFFKEFGGEILEEIGETGFQEGANAAKGPNDAQTGLSIILSGFAMLATAWHCITPGGNMSRIYRENGISVGNTNFNNTTNSIEITLDYSGDYNAIVEYYTKNKFKLKDGHLEMPNPDNPAITNVIYLHKTEVSYEARGLASQLSGFGISIDTETGKGYYQKMSDIMALELSGTANVEIDPKTKKVRVISGGITLELEQDYFGGKSHKFDISTSQALNNSKMMDNLSKAFDENNPSSDIIQQAREEIQKQIKEATGKDIQLTDEQIISIFKSHKEPGLIGNLGISELSAKDHILAETIEDADIRRFLLESGFCAKSELDLRDPLSVAQKNQIEYRIKGGENSELTENPEITKAKKAMIEAIEQVKKDITKVEQELEQAKQEGNKEKIEKTEKKLQTLKNKEIVITAILEKIENSRFGLKQLLEGKPIGQLKDGTVVYAETIEQFLELYQLGLNEGKTTIVDENGKETDLKWKKIDETSRMLALKYYYEAIMKPLGLTIFADPSLTMENVNENFVDETNSDGFEIKESDKLTAKKGEVAGKIGDNILEQIAINEGRIAKGEKIGDIKSVVNEEIEKLKDKGKETTESKIATELWTSIQKHSEGKISAEDQAYLFAFSMKEMADYMTAYPDITAEQVFTLLNSNQNKLIHQHLRDLNTVTSSDHGIKHIMRGNITLAENIFLQLENEGYWENLYENNKKEGETKDQFKARRKILTRQAVIDHDLGYTHVANKAFDEEGFGKTFHMVSDHPLRSTTWIDNNQTFYTILFGEDGYNSLIESVPGHGNAQTQNISKIADGTATQTEFIRGILSCVDCAGSPGDYKIAHMFAQKEMIGGLFNAYSLLDTNNIEGAKQALTNLIKTIEAMPDSGGLGLIKESRKKGIDAFLTNKDFNNMSPDDLKDTFKFHFNKFLGAFGVVTEIDPNTGRVKAGINENGGFSIEFALAGESFEILAERFGAGVALKSLIGVCDDYKINDKGPTSKYLEWQTQQSINKRKNDGKIKPLKEYITDYFNHTPTETEIGEFNDYLKKKAGNKRKESDIVSFKDGTFYTGTKADDASIDFSPDRGIIMKGPNNVEITLNFDGKSYEGFNETAGRFAEMNQKIDGHIKAIEKAKEDQNLLKERTQAVISDLTEYGNKISIENPWLNIEGWSTITDDITRIADEPVINYNELIDKINEIRSTYEIKMQQVQSSNPTLNE